MSYSHQPPSYHPYDGKYYDQTVEFITQETVALQAVEHYPYPILQQYDEELVPRYIPAATYPLYDHVPFSQPGIPCYNVDVPHQPVPPIASSEHSVHIHAPVPISAYSTLLPSIQQPDRTPTPRPPAQSALASSAGPTAYASPSRSSDLLLPAAADGKTYNSVDCYARVQQATFPTPCELLTELASNERASGGQRVPAQARPASAVSLEQFCTSPGPVSPHTSSPAVSGSLSHSDADDGECGRGRGQRKSRPPVPKKSVTNQRKARFRAVAENIGFKSTDPDTITSHDKKRHYLECVEQYVLWMHEQLRLVGADSVQLERLTEYPGMCNQSMRTVLVHMQNECRTLRGEVLKEEQLYMELEKEVLELEQKEATTPDADEEPPAVMTNFVPSARRHSIASGMIPLLVAAHGDVPGGLDVIAESFATS